MLIKVLKGKLHRATVTKAKLHYPGSIAIDSALLEASGIIPYENVLIADLDNGNRLETYVVPAEAGSGCIEILGAAAQRIKQGDTVIILAFGYCTEHEAKEICPQVVVLGEENRIIDEPNKKS